ncbi:39S ribosomal protein L34, mitochondrial [Rana temporaria]|uniref:39S ribosomal protein L34, mitochondrial n=1 Tax=Rana temporaria TaxID=8407 RepID=UPI001AADAC96|nr:39S ribosomal protein L34, mitochondrial [Rana temporaria]
MAVLGVVSRLLWQKPSLPALFTQHRTISNVFRSMNLGEYPSSLLPAGNSILTRAVPSHWSLLPVRTKKRGMEYQPKFLKRQRTHGWFKRISTRGGIEVILRRTLKGRKSLTV